MASPIMPVSTIMMALRMSATSTMLNGAGQLPISTTRKPLSMVERISQMLAASKRAVATTPTRRCS